VIEPLNQPIRVGETVLMNASRSVDIGVIVSYDWDFGDGTSGTGAVAPHTYATEGAYQVSLNVTNNEGYSNVKTFQVVVESVSIDIALIIKAILLVSVVLLAFAFTYLMLTKRQGKNETETQAAARSARATPEHSLFLCAMGSARIFMRQVCATSFSIQGLSDSVHACS